VWHDVSFWLPERDYHVNKLHELIRDIGGDLVEDVRVTDEVRCSSAHTYVYVALKIAQFVNPKTGRASNAVRITYRHMDRSLTNAEIDVIQVFAVHRVSRSRIQCRIELGAHTCANGGGSWRSIA
jgi:phenylalanyl-tRNA synthetase alpha chain